MTTDDLTSRYSPEVRDAGAAWLADGASIPEDVLAPHVGEWVILTVVADPERPTREQAELVQRVWHDLLIPSSSLAKLARGVADHYAPWETSTAEKADAAAGRQLDAVLVAIRRRHDAVDEQAREVALRQGARLAREPVEFPFGAERMTLFLVAVAGGLLASTAVPSYSGWRIVWFAIAGAAAVIGIYSVVRRPRIVVGGDGVQVHRLFRTIRYSWVDIAGVEVDTYETRQALLWTQEHEQLILWIRTGGARAPARRITPTYGHEPALLRSEIAAYAATQGIKLIDQPSPPKPGFLQLLPGMVGGAVLFGGLVWALGNGTFLAMLDRRVDTEWVETSIALELQDDYPGAGYVECPDTVKNDPDATFTCEVEELTEVSAVDVHFTSYRHDAYEFEVRP